MTMLLFLITFFPPNLQETHEVVLASALLHSQRLSGWQDEISDRCSQAKVVSLFDESHPVPATSISDDWQWLVSHRYSWL